MKAIKQMAILCVKLWWCFPDITGQKMGPVMLNSCKQQTMLVHSKTPPFSKATPKFKDMLAKRIVKTHRAKSSGLWGWVLPSNKAGAETGGSIESRACFPPQGRIKELLWSCRLCSGSCSAPCEQRVKSYLCWNIKAGRQQSAINRAYKLSTDKALILLL